MAAPAKRFIFHDYETDSTDWSHGQPLSWAAVITDSALTPIASHDLRIRPRIDTLPHPMAYRVHRLRPSELHAEGMSELAAMRAIQTEVRRSPGTVLATYNGVSADDEISRHGFWRNLLPPYEHEFKDGNRRLDLYPVMMMTRVMQPHLLNWPAPDPERGKRSMKLADIAAANGIDPENAHDALADCEMLLALARRLAEGNPRYWRYITETMIDRNAMRPLLQGAKPVLHFSRYYGHERDYTGLVLPLMTHPKMGNRIIGVDLRRSPEDLLQMTSEEIRAYLFTPRDQRDERAPEVPLVQIAANQCEAIVQSEGMLSQELVERLGLDLELINTRAERIQAQPGLRDRVAPVFESDFPPIPYAYAALYEGFLSRNDQRIIDRQIQQQIEHNASRLRLERCDVYGEANRADDPVKVAGLLLGAKYRLLLEDYADPVRVGERLEEISASEHFSPSELVSFVRYLEERFEGDGTGAAINRDSFDELLRANRMEADISPEELALLDEVEADSAQKLRAFEVLRELAIEQLDAARRERTQRPEVDRVLTLEADHLGISREPDFRTRRRARESVEDLTIG